jgi:O-6-methylguanine DNA methyltransferase
MASFKDRVIQVVKGIPKGEVMTYGEVAEAAGGDKHRNAREVGMVMSRNFDSSVPCHRVIKGNGEVGDYNRGGAEAKIEILKKEGTDVRNFKI